MAPSADDGLEASRRMHEYLLAKQRRQEEFWLRKYGKVMQPQPPNVGKPAANPRLPPIGAVGDRGLPGGTSEGSSGAQPAPGALPAIPGAPHHRQPRGQAPIFQAKEPVKDFFSRNARQPRGAAAAVAAARNNDYNSNLPAVNRRPPEPYRKDRLAGKLPPMASSPQQGSPQQQPSHGLVTPERSYGQQSDQGSPGSGSGSSAPRSLPPLAHEASGSPGQAGLRSSYPGGAGISLPALAPSASSQYHQKPLRNLELELSVIKAIKAREDVLERLRVAGGKLDSGFGGAAPVVLSPVDPLVRLFYRLVGSLRQRTLDAVEAIAVWRRKVSPAEPFVYYGADYLAGIGPDCAFLDTLPFLRSRLTFGRAADDPFLAEVTPDGIPIEEATTCDLRRGGQRFSPDALRIRMARKVLAQFCGRPLPNQASDMSSVGLGGEASSPGPVSQEPDMDAKADRSDVFGAGPHAALEALPEEEDEEEEDEENNEVSVQVPQYRMPSPPLAAAVVVPPAVARAITPPAALFSPVPVAPPAAAEASIDLAAEPEQDAGPGADVSELSPRAAATAEPGSDADATHASSVAAQGEQPAQEQQSQEQTAGVVPAEFEDDGEFIDFALGAIIHSLEPPYVDAIPHGGFTVSGWEIDRQLEEVVGGIASPPNRGSLSTVPVPAAAAAASAPVPQPPASRGQEPTATSKPPSRSGSVSTPTAAAAPLSAVPVPPPGAPSSKPPSRGGPSPPSSKPPSRGSPAGTSLDAKPSSRGVPAPPAPAVRPPSRGSLLDSAPKPPSRGAGSVRPGSRGSNAEAGTAAVGLPNELEAPGVLPAIAEDRVELHESPVAPGLLSQRAPVRVHLRPNSRGLNMNLSMDGSGSGLAPAAAAAVPAAGGAPVRVHLRPNSRGLNMNLSMDGSGSGLVPAAAAAVPAAGGAPVRVHLRPHSRGLDMNLSMERQPATARSVAMGPDADKVEGEQALPAARSIAESGTRSHTRSAALRPPSRDVQEEETPGLQFPVAPFPAAGPLEEEEDGEEEDQGNEGQGEAHREGAEESTVSSRAPVRVHLRPNSRGLNMNLSMDGADTGLGCAAAETSSSAGGAPVRVHLRPHSRGLDMNLSMDGSGSSSAPAAGWLAPIAEERSERFGAANGLSRRSVVSLRPPSRDVEDEGEPGSQFPVTPFPVGPPPEDDEEEEEEEEGAQVPGDAADSEASKPPVRVHLRPYSRGLDLNLSMDR